MRTDMSVEMGSDGTMFVECDGDWYRVDSTVVADFLRMVITGVDSQ